MGMITGKIYVEVVFVDWEVLVLLHPEIKIAIAPVSILIKTVVVIFLIIIITTVDGSAENFTSIKKGGYLAIPIADLSQTASFYKADIDGTEIELVTLKDSKGNLRTAFNACQVCYSSGKGYYVQDGNYLVCQNCGNSFTIDQVGIASGGCNPWPILDSDRTVTDDEIQISYDVLKATADELPKFFQ